ncbi:MAG TPA: zinc ribbon domain-containing protein, partial [Ktedonobacteraceae bacterium]
MTKPQDFRYSRATTVLMYNRSVGQGARTVMGKCLDLDGCGFENRDKARFCGHCGIPTKGSFLQGRYEIQALTGKEHNVVTLQAIDRHGGLPIIVRALIPRETNTQDREDFLQDAELAASISERIRETGSICVTDYGQDGPVVFLAKKEFTGTEQHLKNFRMITRISSDPLALSSPVVQIQNENNMEATTQIRRVVSTDPEITQLQAAYTPP